MIYFRLPPSPPAQVREEHGRELGRDTQISDNWYASIRSATPKQLFYSEGTETITRQLSTRAVYQSPTAVSTESDASIFTFDAAINPLSNTSSSVLGSTGCTSSQVSEGRPPDSSHWHSSKSCVLHMVLGWMRKISRSCTSAEYLKWNRSRKCTSLRENESVLDADDEP